MLDAAPTVTTKAKGEPSIQPAYFTSDIFVDALRKDVLELGQTFAEEYSVRRTDGEQPNPRPFRLFKTIWARDGWQWLHLKILEARPREAFVSVVLRIFLGERFLSLQIQ